MPSNTVGDGPRYWAFISYSHKDAAFGRRLHRQLERYALPRRLVGRDTAQGTLPRRLIPIFRDRDELPAAKDLSAEVRAALLASKALVVVCSPAAAVSLWVSREVEVFQALNPSRPILAALIEGRPDEGFPDSLRLTATGALVEPLAADFRAGGDGERLGLLKLIAGIAGIGLDELVQRDAQRRMQRVTAITAGALAGMLAMSVLTTFALNARTDADRQRAEAEGLVEFMLTDLRTTLKGVGRLDAMTAVNERALRYYGNRDLDSLPPESLERRARIFHAMGEDDESRGDHAAALAKFMEARRTTAALLAAAPNDPNRIFDHAQSEFWIGQVAYARMQYKDAKTGFKAYKALVDRLVSISPNNPKYQREAGYADGNLCVIALKAPKDPVSALILCRAALNHMEAAARFSKMSGTVIADLANRHGWLAGAYSANGNNREALTHRLIQERMLEELMGVDSKNMDLKTRWIGVQRILAWIEATSGQQQDALARLRRAANVSDQLVAFDPSNKSWAAQRARITSDFAEVAGLQTKRTLR